MNVSDLSEFDLILTSTMNLHTYHEISIRFFLFAHERSKFYLPAGFLAPLVLPVIHQQMISEVSDDLQSFAFTC